MSDGSTALAFFFGVFIGIVACDVITKRRTEDDEHVTTSRGRRIYVTEETESPATQAAQQNTN